MKNSLGVGLLVVDRVTRAAAKVTANAAELAGMVIFVQMGAEVSRVCVRVPLPVATH